MKSKFTKSVGTKAASENMQASPAPKPPEVTETFDQFINRMLASKKLTTEMLSEVLGRDFVNRLLDNSNNWIGAATTNESGTPVLEGQTHETLGAIPDLKARIAQLIENSERANAEQAEEEEQLNLEAPSAPKI